MIDIVVDARADDAATELHKTDTIRYDTIRAEQTKYGMNERGGG
jgi:hypothetical protein